MAQQDGDRRSKASALRALGWVSVFFSDVAGFAFLGWLIDKYGRTEPWGIAAVSKRLINSAKVGVTGLAFLSSSRLRKATSVSMR